MGEMSQWYLTLAQTGLSALGGSASFISAVSNKAASKLTLACIHASYCTFCFLASYPVCRGLVNMVFNCNYHVITELLILVTMLNVS